MPHPWRIVFAGTPDFAVPSLDALLAHDMAPVAVYTQPDRRAGRGRSVQASPVKRRALTAGIPVMQPDSLRDAAAADALGALEPDLMVVVAYGQILPSPILALPTHGCINVHASLLPRWRGAAPIQRAILAGDTETGVCIMRMEAGLDTGPVLSTRKTDILPDDTAGTLHDRLAALGAAALVDAVQGLAAGALDAVPQPEDGVTYARKLEKSEAALDWRRPAHELARQVRAFDPWPVAQATLEGRVIRIWRAVSMEQESGSGAPHRDSVEPGTILSAAAEGLRVATGSGELLIQEVQLSGGRRIAARDFANQRPLAGLRLG